MTRDESAVTRRGFLGVAGGVVGSVALARVGRGEETALSQRYPDPLVKIVDPSFAKYRIQNAKVERLATGMRWCEGPVYVGDARCLLWSDIPNNRIMRWDEETAGVSVYRKPSNNSNGLARDRQGRLLTCEHDARRVTRTEYDGSVTVLADSFEGKPLNSPNDIVCKSDGSVWFSDPPYGISGWYEGHRREAELPANLYRWDPGTKKVSVVAAGEVNRPNGLAFSGDESVLYVIDTGVSPRVIRVYDVVDGGKGVANGRALVTAEKGATPDGLRIDVDGNLWCGWGMGTEELDGVSVFNSSGKLIGHIALPERCANLCFGGAERNRLFMAASTSVYSLFVNTQGVALV